MQLVVGPMISGGCIMDDDLTLCEIVWKKDMSHY